MATHAPPMPPLSPQIAALERDLAAGNAAALAAFWREVADRGAPLIEPLPGDDRRCLVTFLWRGAAPAAVITQLASRLHGTGAALLTHLPHSDVRYATFLARRDLRTTYWLSVADATGATRASTGDCWVVDDKNWRADPLNP